jgi:hypothetical protein
MISVLKLSSGEFIITEHHESDEVGSVVRVKNPFVVDWRVGNDGVPYIMLMRWMVGVKTEIVTLTKASIVAIFSPTAQLEEQYIEGVYRSNQEDEEDESEENTVTDTDFSFLEDLVKNLRESSLREEEESLEEEIDNSKFISPGNKTIH